MERKPQRAAKRAVVVRTERLTPNMIRVFFTGNDLRGLTELPFSDHYIKIVFPPVGADYRWPFDLEGIRESRPAEQWPVTRTYTIRSYDPQTGEMAVDFVLHGDEGLAGPWAAGARAGDEIGFLGPGGAYAPDENASAHLFVGDEAAIPAIAAALDRLPPSAKADVFLEVFGIGDHQPMPTTARTTLTWVHRADRPYGQALAAAVRSAPFPDGDVQVFVHGNAEMVRDLRRYLFVDRRLDRSRVSISGYWRTGQTEDRWQSTKRDFAAQMESEEQVALAGR
jgi:NADPH-dependent ferric siderophore reductase